MIELWRFFQTNRIDFSKWPRKRTSEGLKARLQSFTNHEVNAANLVDLLRYICYTLQLNNHHEVSIQDGDTLIALQQLKKWYSTITARTLNECVVLEKVEFYLCFRSGSLCWQNFHCIFVLFDLFQLTIQTLDYALVENTKSANVDQAYLEVVSDDIKDMISLTWDHIHSIISKLLEKLRSPGTAAKMVENTITNDENLISCDLKALIGMPGLEEVAANICSSWVEGLEGIMRTKVSR